MIGLVLAALYVGLLTLLYGGDGLPAAIQGIAAIGFWWHCAWVILMQLFIACMGVICVISSVACLAMDDAKKGAATFAFSCGALITLAFASLYSFLTSLLWVMVTLLVYYAAPEQVSTSFADWDLAMLSFGGALSLIAVYVQSKWGRMLLSTANKINAEKKAALV